MHVRERHENTRREVTFYRYALKYMATHQRLGVQRVNAAFNNISAIS
jgi:hypothetical protein